MTASCVHHKRPIEKRHCIITSPLPHPKSLHSRGALVQPAAHTTATTYLGQPGGLRQPRQHGSNRSAARCESPVRRDGGVVHKGVSPEMMHQHTALCLGYFVRPAVDACVALRHHARGATQTPTEPERTPSRVDSTAFTLGDGMIDQQKAKAPDRSRHMRALCRAGRAFREEHKNTTPRGRTLARSLSGALGQQPGPCPLSGVGHACWGFAFVCVASDLRSIDRHRLNRPH